MEYDMKINGGGANTSKVMHALMVRKPVSAYMFASGMVFIENRPGSTKQTLRKKEYVPVIESTF